MNLLTTLRILSERAQLFESIRNFFKKEGVIEVDTRLLERFTVSDPYMKALEVYDLTSKSVGFLQTSPEYSMKRLLSLGSGDIYQLGKAFRAEEKGIHHDTEFTMLEWYRLNFGIQELMQEVYLLVDSILDKRMRVDFSYRDAFTTFVGIDPFLISNQDLESFTRDKLGDIPQDLLRDNYLSLLFSEVIEPSFDPSKVTFVYYYPESQASLAKAIELDDLVVAERFEVYCGGIELANGFHELTDSEEQLSRFKQDNIIRKQIGEPQIAIDTRLIEALENGVPDCSGVALGVDRLLMIKLQQSNISDVLPLG